MLPTPFIILLLILGVILLWKNKVQGKYVVTTATALLLIFSLSPVSNFLLNLLQNKYVTFQVKDHPGKHFKYVVVLGGGVHPEDEWPLTSQITPHTLMRVVEGVRILRELPDAKLIFTGKGPKSVPEAVLMQQMALKLGVAPEKILVEQESMNTLGHTKYLKEMIGQDLFVLVTTGMHMPRAAALFKTAGYHFVPAPTAHVFTRTPAPLMAADGFFYELYGNLWYRLKGDIK